MKCDNCNCKETYVKDYENKFTIKGKTISFISKRRFCKNCNELVYDEDLDNLTSELAINKYNFDYGIDSEDIIKLRKSFGLSQELFSKIIGCAKKTLISYEKGKSIPNDSYMILIKSLIAEPETIKTLINVNKSSFTDKEYEKLINLKINNNYIINSSILSMDELMLNSEPTEYNGYTMISPEKLINIISYFSEGGISKTKLLKEMFYSDFINYKESCTSITGLEYAKLMFGPVPDQFQTILNILNCDNTINYDIHYHGDFEEHEIKSNIKFNSDIFSKEELDILKRVKKKFKDFNVKEIVNYSHKEKAFTETEFYKKISYDLAFDLLDF